MRARLLRKRQGGRRGESSPNTQPETPKPKSPTIPRHSTQQHLSLRPSPRSHQCLLSRCGLCAIRSISRVLPCLGKCTNWSPDSSGNQARCNIPADGGASGASTTSPFHASGVLRMRGKNGYTRHCSAGERVLRIRGKNGHSVALYRMECSIYTILHHPIPDIPSHTNPVPRA